MGLPRDLQRTPARGLLQADARGVREAQDPGKYQRPSANQTVPVQQFRRLLAASNPGLKPEDFAIYCDDTYLREVRVCLDKNLNFRACGTRVRDACRIDAMLLRAVK